MPYGQTKKFRQIIVKLPKKYYLCIPEEFLVGIDVDVGIEGAENNWRKIASVVQRIE